MAPTGLKALAFSLAVSLIVLLASPARADDVKYLEIPITGTFGQEIMPWGVEQALKRAEEEKVEYIIFRFNSSGGMVWSAKEICKLIDRNQS